MIVKLEVVAAIVGLRAERDQGEMQGQAAGLRKCLWRDARLADLMPARSSESHER